ncbi:hypothetical protein D3C87_1853420 [compost metagenome]
MVSYNPKRLFTESIKKTILITDCEIKAAKIICSLENFFNNIEFNWLEPIKLTDIKAKIQPYVLAFT